MKKLIICTDGTWDKPGETDANGKPLDSNVCILYNAIIETDKNGIRQLKAYETGVGTGYSVKDQLGGGVMGAGIDKKIKDVYTFLLLNYEPGDPIYLFGFSRGAYTARSLAGFIRNCGILRPEYIHLVDKAYELYRDRNVFSQPDSDLMISFRRNYCFENITRIKMIGVWDTVGALGIPLPIYASYNTARYQFHDVTLSSTVDYAFQALAVDERRKPFAPSLWQASKNSVHGENIAVEQRWFPGVHCNVGGGYANRGLSDQTLLWLVEKAELAGLEIDHSKLQAHPDALAEMGNSFTPAYWITGKIWRVVGDPQYINQVVDNSVNLRMVKISSYRPQNVLT